MATVAESVTPTCDPIANGSTTNGPRANGSATVGANSGYCVPTAPEEITASWLSGILGLPVKSFTITSSIQNEATSKLFITLTYADGAAVHDASRLRPDRLCLKGSFNPAKLATPGYTEVFKAVFMREVDVFDRLRPRLSHTGLRLPQVWGTARSTDPFQAMLAMEDLNQRGCTYGDPATALPVPLVTTAVEQLAALHAATWGFALADHPWLTRDYPATILSLAVMWDDVVLGADRPHVPDVIRGRDRTVAALKKHFAAASPRFQCVLHGDPHPGNVYIDAEGRPSFLDWQICHIGSAFHDVAYFIVGALSVADRRTHEMAILGHYLQTLAELGGPRLSQDDEEVMQEYRRCMITGMGWVMTPYFMQRKERLVPMVERYCAAMVDHEVIELVESLP